MQYVSKEPFFGHPGSNRSIGDPFIVSHLDAINQSPNQHLYSTSAGGVSGVNGGAAAVDSSP